MICLHWRGFSRDFEKTWTDVVANNIKAGFLPDSDPVVATRLVMGACIWISRWYRSDGPYDEQKNDRFYTMPVTTAANDQEGFARALYGGKQSNAPGARA